MKRVKEYATAAGLVLLAIGYVADVAPVALVGGVLFLPVLRMMADRLAEGVDDAS